jgi:hypothetical protein
MSAGPRFKTAAKIRVAGRPEWHIANILSYSGAPNPACMVLSGEKLPVLQTDFLTWRGMPAMTLKRERDITGGIWRDLISDVRYEVRPL